MVEASTSLLHAATLMHATEVAARAAAATRAATAVSAAALAEVAAVAVAAAAADFVRFGSSDEHFQRVLMFRTFSDMFGRPRLLFGILN